MLVGLPSDETKCPALQFDHFEHDATFSREENVPGPHAEHDRLLVGLPSDETKCPALQFDHFEQAPWLEPVEKVCGPHEEHARSEVEDPAALTKVPPPQTVQGVHLAVGGRLDSNTVVEASSEKQSSVWQSVPCNVLVLGEHDPVNGVTVHGLKAQAVGPTYLSAPPLLPSYP